MTQVLAGYRAPAVRERALDHLAAAAGAEVHVLGTSVEGRPIRAACVTNPADAATYRALCATFAGAQPHIRYRRAAARALDLFTGEQEDHQHHAHGTWALTVEHYPLWVDVKRFFQASLFRRFNPPDPERWIENDVPGIVAYLRAALAIT